MLVAAGRSVHPVARPPLVVDLTMVGPSSSSPAGEAHIPAKRANRPPERAKSRKPTVYNHPVPAVAAMPTEAATLPVVARQPEDMAQRFDAAVRSGNPPGLAGAQPAGASGRAPVGEPSPVPSTETLKKRYLSEHFAYIQDLILQKLSYPAAARRMGWSGRVVVAFMVATDGKVGGIRVVAGSGYQTLDRNAVETVRSASPFPRPPVAAELTLPIVYNLE